MSEKDLIAVADAFEPKYRRVLSAYGAKMALAYAEGGKKAMERSFELFKHVMHDLIEKNHLVSIPRGMKAVQVKGTRARKGVKVTLEDSDDEELAIRIAADFARKHPNRSDDVAQTTIDLARQAVASGIEAKYGPDKIARLIKDSVGGAVGDYRARMIARTESAAAFNFANLETVKDMEDSTGPLMKTWVAATDERVRDTHAEIDGTSVPLEDTFKVGDSDLSFPGDPSGSPEEIINCRCTLVYEPASG